MYRGGYTGIVIETVKYGWVQKRAVGKAITWRKIPYSVFNFWSQSYNMRWIICIEKSAGGITGRYIPCKIILGPHRINRGLTIMEPKPPDIVYLPVQS